MIIKPKLKQFKKKDGTNNIVIYCYDKQSHKKAEIPTIYNVEKKYFKDGKIILKPNANYINAQLNLICSDIELYWLKHPNIDVSELKNYNKKVLIPEQISFSSFVEMFMQGIKKGTILNKGKNFSHYTVKCYATYAKYILSYLGGKSWENITFDWYNGFVNYLRNEKKFNDNTIAKAIKTLKSLMSKGSKYHSNIDYLKFNASYIDVETIFLNEVEIEQIMNCYLPSYLEEERDRFYLSYNLFLRFGDSIKLKKENIFKIEGKHYVNVYHEKTKNNAVIPLFGRSLSILEKNDYFFSKTTNQQSNLKLKEIGKLAGINEEYVITKINNGVITKEKYFKYELITTHTARRSMATNLYLKGFDIKQIQLMGGWNNITTFEKYLKINKLQNAINAGKNKFFD